MYVFPPTVPTVLLRVSGRVCVGVRTSVSWGCRVSIDDRLLRLHETSSYSEEGISTKPFTFGVGPSEKKGTTRNALKSSIGIRQANF